MTTNLTHIALPFPTVDIPPGGEVEVSLAMSEQAMFERLLIPEVQDLWVVSVRTKISELIGPEEGVPAFIFSTGNLQPRFDAMLHVNELIRVRLRNRSGAQAHIDGMFAMLAVVR